MNPLSGLHILVVPSWWPSPEKPISGIFFTDYVRAFSAAGAKVGVIFPDLISIRQWGGGTSIPIRPRLTWEDLDGVPVARIRGLHTALGRPAWQMGRFRRWLRWGLREYRARHGVPDVLHAMISIPAGWACTHLDDPPAARVVITEETGPFSLVMTPGTGESFVRAAMAKAAKVVTVSERSRADIQLHGIDREILVCGNPVAKEFTDPTAKPRRRGAPARALFVGRMVAEKGVLDLADAVSGQEWASRVEWHFAGDGAALNETRDRFARNGLMAVFHGQCDRRRVAELMAESDFFVLPSHGETFGQAVAEALCMGLPVVTTRDTACGDFITPADGVLVEIANIASLRKGIHELVGKLDSFDCSAIAAQARSRFSGAAVAHRYSQWFRNALEG